MSADPDEEALAWAGETDPSHVDGPAVAPPITGPATPPVLDALEGPADPKPIPAALLVTYGILAGVYLIYTIGWVTTVVRYQAVRIPFTDPLSEIMFQLGEFLAIASPALWFAAVFLLSRGRKPLVRLLWILVGLIAVLPWPFVLGVWA